MVTGYRKYSSLRLPVTGNRQVRSKKERAGERENKYVSTAAPINSCHSLFIMYVVGQASLRQISQEF